jgi:ribose transport system substrate-binding protein
MRSPADRSRRGRSVAVGLAVLALAACSSGSATAKAKGSGSGTSSRAQEVAAARKRLAPWLHGTSRPVPTSGPAAQPNKSIYVVSCGQLLESCSVLVDGVMKAADAIGWHTTLFDTKLDFSSAGDAIRQAMAAGADGAIVVGVDCQHFTGALDQANAAKFPVVVLNAFDCDVTSGGKEKPRFSAQVRFTPGNQDPVDSAKALAAAKADYAIEATDGNLKVINLQQDDLLAAKLLGEGFAEGVARCHTCEIVDTVKFSTSDLLDGTFAQKVASALVQHPEANAIHFPYAASVALGTAGLRDAGRAHLIVLGGEGMPSQYKLVNNGTLDMVMAFSAGWTGFGAVDTLNRVFAGAGQVDEGVGYQLVTKSTLHGADTWDVGQDYRATYRKVWGVG